MSSAQPVMSRLPGERRTIALGVIALLAVLVRTPLLDSLTHDTTIYVVPWYEHVLANGLSALGEAAPNLNGETGGNYSPPYYYLLYVVGWFDGLFPAIWLIKFISFGFDALAAYFAYKLVRLHLSEMRALLAAAAVLLAPTIVANSAWWGQADMMWTSLILGSLYCTLSSRPFTAGVLFGVGLSFKAQAIFLGPFLLMLWLQGEMRLKHFIVAPLAFGAMMLPAIFMGRNPVEAMTIYLQQAGYFQELSMNAPNLYVFAPDSLYAVGTAAGLLLAAASALGLAALPRVSGAVMDNRAKILAATMFVALMPFLLPKMHDRYFFAADVFAILLAVYAPRLWFVPVLFQASSLAAYVPVITWNLSGLTNVVSAPVAAGALINTVAIGGLVLLYWLACRRPSEPTALAVKHFGMSAVSLCSALALWQGIAFLQAKRCSQEGGIESLLCARPVSADLVYAGALQWMAFALLVASAYVLCRFWLLPWLERRRAAST